MKYIDELYMNNPIRNVVKISTQKAVGIKSDGTFIKSKANIPIWEQINPWDNVLSEKSSLFNIYWLISYYIHNEYLKR